jgi:histidinol-phosphate aminotransferase
MDIDGLARRGLRDIDAYRPVECKASVKLDANESPWALPENVTERLIRWLRGEENLNRYPDSDNTALKSAAAAFSGVGPRNVTCGVGSDQLIDMICRAFLEPGDCVITQKPTFGMYAVSVGLNHGRAVSLPIGYDVGAARELARAAESERAKIIFLCRPNNPTGGSMSEEGLHFLLDNAKCLVVLDEAYGEFAGVSSAGLIGKYRNLAVLKTLSKAFGLAGARVGYVIADSSLIELLDAVKPPFNIPTISQLLATWALEESGECMARAKRLADARDGLHNLLGSLGWLEADRSEANFLYLRSKRDIASILESGGVSVRRFPKSGDEYCVRLTVGTDEENKKVGDLLCEAPK